MIASFVPKYKPLKYNVFVLGSHEFYERRMENHREKFSACGVKSAWSSGCVFYILRGMKYLSFLMAAMAGLCVSAAALAAPLSAVAAKMVSHQALYEISLISKAPGSQLLDITGRMLFSWEKGCDAWITDHETALTYTYADGNVLPITNDFSTVESLDGNTFSFASQRDMGRGMIETYKGRATLTPSGRGMAYYTEPEQVAPVDLPEGTHFPMNHTLAILHKARQGETFYYAPLFDGNEEFSVRYVSVFIGDHYEAGMDPGIELKNNDIDTALLEPQSWDLQLAFFSADKDAEAADYEMSLRAYENGVVSDVVIDYGQFAIRQDLIGLKLLEQQDCD